MNIKDTIANEIKNTISIKDNFVSLVKKNVSLSDLPTLLTSLKVDIVNSISDLEELMAQTTSLLPTTVDNGLNSHVNTLINTSNITLNNIKCEDENDTLDDIDIDYELNEIINDVYERCEEDYERVSKSSKKLNIGDYILMLVLILSIIAMIKKLIKSLKLLSETRFPSLTLFNVSIKPSVIRLRTLGELSKQYKDTVNISSLILKITDVMLLGVATYILSSIKFNISKSKTQDMYNNDFKDYIRNNSCESIEDIDRDEETPSEGFKIPNINTYNDISELEYVDCDNIEIIPSLPFLQKVSNFTCGVSTPTQSDDIVIMEEDTFIEKAIFKNIGDNLHSTVNINYMDYVTPEIMSPISGNIDKIYDGDVYISNIQDGDLELQNDITNLVDLYKEKSDIEQLLQNVYFYTVYPFMLNSSNVSNLLNVGYKKVDSVYNNKSKEVQKINDKFNKDIQNISSQSNVETYANNEQSEELANIILELKDKLIQNIKLKRTECKNINQDTRYDLDDLNLISYYKDEIIFRVLECNESEQSKELLRIINNFILNRLFYEKLDRNEFIKYINNNLKSYKVKYIDVENIYKKNKSHTDVYDYLISVTNDMFLSKKVSYSFYTLNLDNKISVKTLEYKLSDLSSNVSIIEMFWAKLLKRIDEIEKDILSINNTIDNYSLIDNNFSIEDINGELYRVYNFESPTDICDKNSFDINSEFNPNTKVGFDNIKYWRRYFNMATITGCLPIYWSTGLILLGAPIPMPIIYTPIKSLKTKWGVIVIGLGICGIAISPLVLYVNLENKAVSLIPNAVEIMLNKTLGLLKKELVEAKNVTLKGVINENLNILKSEISDIDKIIKQEEQNIDNIKRSMPTPPKINADTKIISIPNISNIRNISIKYENKEYVSNLDKLMQFYDSEINGCLHSIDNAELYSVVNDYFNQSKNYMVEYSTHLIACEKLKESKYELSVKYDKLQKKLNDSTQKCEEFPEITVIDNNISTLESKIEDTQTKLQFIFNASPIGVLSPNSINFGMSIKKYNLVNNIDNDIAKVYNMVGICDILSKIDILPDDYMNNPITPNIMGILKNVDDALGLLKLKDVLPKYENLSISNIKFLYFLTSTFCVDGAKQFGLVGYPQ